MHLAQKVKALLAPLPYGKDVVSTFAALTDSERLFSAAKCLILKLHGWPASPGQTTEIAFEVVSLVVSVAGSICYDITVTGVCAVGLIKALLSCSHVDCLYCWCLDITVSSYILHVGREAKTWQPQSGGIFLTHMHILQNEVTASSIGTMGISNLLPTVRDPYRS